MENVMNQQNSNLKANLSPFERDLKKAFETDFNSEFEPTFEFEAKLNNQLLQKAEEINAKNPSGHFASNEKAGFSFLKYFSISLSTFVVVLALFSGLFLLKTYNENQSIAGNLASQATVTPANTELGNLGNFGTSNSESLGTETIIKATEKAVVCTDICDSKKAYDAIISRFNDNYSYRANLIFANLADGTNEYLNFYVNRDSNIRIVKFSDSSVQTESNLVHTQFTSVDKISSDFQNRNNSDLVQIVEGLNTKYSSLPKLELSKAGENKFLTLTYPEKIEGYTGERVQLKIETDKDLLPSKLTATVLSNDGRITSTYNFVYSNYNVANSTVNSMFPTELNGIDTVDGLLANVSDLDIFNFSADINDSNSKAPSYREWGDAYKVSDSIYNAKFKVFSNLGLLEYTLYDNKSWMNTFDFTNYSWGEYKVDETNSIYLEGYTFDLSPIYVIKFFTGKEYQVKSFKSSFDAVENVMKYTIATESPAGETFEGVFYVDANKKIIKQKFVSTENGKAEENVNYFYAKDSVKNGISPK